MPTDRLDLSLFIAGEWLNGPGRPSEPVLDPATGEPVGELPHATRADLDRALESATAASSGGRRC
jgi:succinate-semialdehyde dehydrogenase/glutarate-semialdehyde dehydrogenase